MWPFFIIVSKICVVRTFFFFLFLSVCRYVDSTAIACRRPSMGRISSKTETKTELMRWIDRSRYNWQVVIIVCASENNCVSHIANDDHRYQQMNRDTELYSNGLVLQAQTTYTNCFVLFYKPAIKESHSTEYMIF